MVLMKKHETLLGLECNYSLTGTSKNLWITMLSY